jgi:hypothetical protein
VTVEIMLMLMMMAAVHRGGLKMVAVASENGLWRGRRHTGKSGGSRRERRRQQVAKI